VARPGEVVLREPVDRPRLLRLAIRSETGSGADVARGVVAHIDGGYFLAGPPATPLHTVALWAGLPPYVLSLGCLPTERVATVEVWPARESVEDPAPGPVTIERYGEVVTLTRGDGDGELVVDLVWADQ
jgi:hypothetical protein